MARIVASPRQAINSKAVIPVQRDAQRKNCHPKIEQLKNCQLKKHTLEVFAEFISSLLSLSEDCGEFWLSRISQSTKRSAAYSRLFFYMNATWVTCVRLTRLRNKNKQCDSWISRRAANVALNGLQAIGQETHVGRLLFELGDVSLSHPLQLRGVAKQILTCAGCVFPLKPGSLLLLKDFDQAGIDEIGLLQGGGEPRLELGAGGLH
jgi:hypothetical protein